MQSITLQLYKDWLAWATPQQVEFVDLVYSECEAHYSQGGDTIVECFEPREILKEFNSMEDVKEYCGLKVEQELNCRWGEDSDPQLKRYEANKTWE